MIDIKKYINEIVSDALAKLNVQSNIVVENHPTQVLEIIQLILHYL